jgi:hypothetical protein
MKTKLLAFFCIFSLLLTACGSEGKEASTNNNAVSETPSATESSSEKDSEVISADKGIFSVDVTVPASLFEGASEDEILAAAKEAGFEKVNFNEAGSVIYTMDKAKHKEYLEDLKQGVDELITEILNDKETYPSFSEILYNENLTEFTILCDKNKYGIFDSFVSLAFYIHGNIYQAFNGVDSDSLRTVVLFVDQDTGDIIETADSTKIGEN